MSAQVHLFPARQQSAAFFSECEIHRGAECMEHCTIEHCTGRRYRYQLRWSTGVHNHGVCLFALANPSTANAKELDPTVRRCVGYAKSWGFGWCWVVNCRAWRATDPRDVPADPLAVGPENDQWVITSARNAHLVVCGWGELGGDRGPEMLKLIRSTGQTPHALKLTKSGAPGHPLYLSAALKPFPLEVRGG